MFLRIWSIVMPLDARKKLADAADRYYWSAVENFQWRLDVPLTAKAVWKKDDVTGNEISVKKFCEKQVKCWKGISILWERLWFWEINLYYISRECAYCQKLSGISPRAQQYTYVVSNISFSKEKKGIYTDSLTQMHQILAQFYHKCMREKKKLSLLQSHVSKRNYIKYIICIIYNYLWELLVIVDSIFCHLYGWRFLIRMDQLSIRFR